MISENAWRAVLAASAVALVSGCEADLGDGRVQWVAFSRTLTPADAAGITVPFTVTDEGTQEIRIEFTFPITNRDAAAFSERAAAAVGIPDKTPGEFDLSWQVLRGSEEIARGEGRDGLIGTISTQAAGSAQARLWAWTTSSARFPRRSE